MTAGFIASFGSLLLFIALLYLGAYVATRKSRGAPTPQRDLTEHLARAEAAAKEVELELARIRNAIVG